MLKNRPKVVMCAVLFALCAFPAQAQQDRVLGPGSAASAGMDASRLEEGLRLYKDAVARDELRGAVLMVARHGKIVLHEAVGWKHHGYRLPMQKDTLFRMASNTKPVIATAVLILEQDGKLRVDDTAGRHLESFNNYRSRGITITHLLSHSSGLRIPVIFYPFDAKDGSPSLRAAADRFGREGPEFEPGTTYSYSNPGFNTVGAIIEAASGMPLEAFLKSRIYDRLGMFDSLNHEDPAKLERMATVYRASEGEGGKISFQQGFTPGDPPDFPIIRASGGLISTAPDYGKFLQMYLNKGMYGGVSILRPESVQKATSPKIKSSETSSYGLGWVISGDGTFWHDGSDGTYAWVDPVHDLFGMVLTQSPGGKNPRDKFRQLVTESCRD